MMETSNVTLSVIIVTYNVYAFVAETIESVLKSHTTFTFDIWVVDNHSLDGTPEKIKVDFPQVHLIANKQNVGFSVANNQAIARSNGKYVLLLNPDTIIQGDTLQVCVNAMDMHEDIGGLGIYMMDGAGHYLPESKRGFPSPWVSFCKMVGLSKLFPQSSTFNMYHLGFLDKDKSHEISILSGAFMMLRRKVLDEVGLLDETFFMYGEDIDLSYRISKGGFKNFYCADSKIIHFKGESTKKASFNYVKTFYQAMSIFARKHFGGGRINFFVFFLNLAVYIKAILSLLMNIWKNGRTIIIDGSIILFSGIGLTYFWEFFYYEGQTYFQIEIVLYNLLLFVLVYLFILYFNGVYDQKPKVKDLLSTGGIAAVVLIAFYGLLDESLRFSRVVVSVLAISTLFTLPLWRNIAESFFNKTMWMERKKKKYWILGDVKTSEKVQHVFGKSLKENEDVFVIDSEYYTDYERLEAFLRNIPQKKHQQNILLFDFSHCSRELAFKSMLQFVNTFQYHFTFGSTNYIIGSASKNQQGELLRDGIRYHLDDPKYRRYKFLVDKIIAFLGICALPFLVWKVESIKNYGRNIWKLCIGRKTFVGYKYDKESDVINLPILQPSIISVDEAIEDIEMLDTYSMNQVYAKDFSPWGDLGVYFRNAYNLGKKSKNL